MCVCVFELAGLHLLLSTLTKTESHWIDEKINWQQFPSPFENLHLFCVPLCIFGCCCRKGNKKTLTITQWKWLRTCRKVYIYIYRLFIHFFVRRLAFFSLGAQSNFLDCASFHWWWITMISWTNRQEESRKTKTPVDTHICKKKKIKIGVISGLKTSFIHEGQKIQKYTEIYSYEENVWEKKRKRPNNRHTEILLKGKEHELLQSLFIDCVLLKSNNNDIDSFFFHFFVIITLYIYWIYYWCWKIYLKAKHLKRCGIKIAFKISWQNTMLMEPLHQRTIIWMTTSLICVSVWNVVLSLSFCISRIYICSVTSVILEYSTCCKVIHISHKWSQNLSYMISLSKWTQLRFFILLSK